MADIFLSYARADRERVLPVLAALKEEGLSVWWDLKILPGTSWRSVLQKMLKGTRCVVVLWSSKSVESHWVIDEASNAYRRDILVPVLIDDALEPPLGFGELQCAKLINFTGNRNDPGFQELCTAIREKIQSGVPTETLLVTAAPAVTGPVGSGPADTAAAGSPGEPPPRVLMETPAGHSRRRWVLMIAAALAVAAGAVAVVIRPRTEMTNVADQLVYRRIPAGEFTMGCQANCEADELPPRQVHISHDFWMTDTEVTVRAYAAFARSTARGMPPQDGIPDANPAQFNPGWMYETHPIVNVSYYDASAYCRWAGGDLPTEAQWEYAARGGTKGRSFPWGDQISRDKANYGLQTPDGALHPRASAAGARDRFLHTAPVRSFEPNGYGLYDMIGNVQEWCRDAFRAYDPGALRDPYAEPFSPSDERVVRGGSFLYDQPDCRLENRSKNRPHERYPDSGFRCVLPAGWR